MGAICRKAFSSNHMPPNIPVPKRASKKDPVKIDLQSIYDGLVTHELFLVFKKRVKRNRNKRLVTFIFLENTRRSLTCIKSNENAVGNIVSNTRGKILALDKIDLKRGLNLDSFNEANEYLKEGLQNLGVLEVTS